MTAKEYLSQAKWLDQRIKSKMEEAESMRALATKATSVYSDMPKTLNTSESSFEKTMVKIIDLEHELNREVDRLVDLKREIGSAIATVDDADCRLLLERRYLLFETWDDISRTLDCSVRNVYILHGKALKMIKIPC